jgi:hypothetical protein
MQAWGSADFQEVEREELQSAWVGVQIRWSAMEAFVSALKACSYPVEQQINSFHACWFKFCVVARDSGFIDLSDLVGLAQQWKKVKDELKKIPGHGKGKLKADKLGLALDWLRDKAELYDCIADYEYSADRPDEDQDEDFEEHPRHSKVRRLA